MSKKYIWLVTIVLAISLCGLIFIQIKYYQSTAKIKEDQFILTVSKALDEVVDELESDDEAKSILEGSSSNQPTNGVNRKKKIYSSGYKIDLPLNPGQHPTAEVSYYQENKVLYKKETELNSKSFNELMKKVQDPQSLFSIMGINFRHPEWPPIWLVQTCL